MVGEISDDGHWIWDGTEWQPHTPNETPQEQPAPQVSEETQVPEPTEPVGSDTTHADAEMLEPAVSLPLPEGQLPGLPLPGMPLPMPAPGSLGHLLGLSTAPPKAPPGGESFPALSLWPWRDFCFCSSVALWYRLTTRTSSTLTTEPRRAMPLQRHWGRLSC